LGSEYEQRTGTDTVVAVRWEKDTGMVVAWASREVLVMVRTADPGVSRVPSKTKNRCIRRFFVWYTNYMQEQNIEKATFAAGCFWGVEEAFRKTSGVIDVVVGYSGGDVEQPTYEIVCTDTTGHAEAVQVTFDSQVVSYPELLKVFLSIHDPTQKDGQGLDVGRQYRSAIFYHSEAQKIEAERALTEFQKNSVRTVVTEVVPDCPFWPAEEYHQQYIEKRAGKASR
jgi:peptide-methionine (S)-S-oxide reductase